MARVVGRSFITAVVCAGGFLATLGARTPDGRVQAPADRVAAPQSTTPAPPDSVDSPADQNALLRKYCVVCHDDAQRTGGLTLEHFDAGQPDRTLVGTIVEKLRA